MHSDTTFTQRCSSNLGISTSKILMPLSIAECSLVFTTTQQENMASEPNKINIRGDERVKWRSADLKGRKYGANCSVAFIANTNSLDYTAYLYGEPLSGKWKATVFLVCFALAFLLSTSP
jgi:hypothetical protein